MNFKLPIHNRILILGASGFIGNALYKELLSFFDVHGTFFTQEGLFGENKVFHKFCTEEDSLSPLLEKVRPKYIISALNGDFKALQKTHSEIVAYAERFPETRILFLSSAEVFDLQIKYPAYEFDKPASESKLGRYKILIENLLLQQLPKQTTILRLPFVLGVNSPRMIQLRQCIKHKAAFEVFPNEIVSVTTEDKIAQQIHYIINQNLTGIYHLASNDVIHHDDLFKEISTKIGDEIPIFKNVYSRNEDCYQAILPKHNKLPKAYEITVEEVIDACTLKDEIITFKH